MVWTLALLPALAGFAVWAAGGSDVGRRRLFVGGAAAGALTLGVAIAAWAAARDATGSYRWGPLLELHAGTAGAAGIVAVVVPAVAVPIAVWASAHEQIDGLARLTGLLLVFVGAMELLVVAADLLTLLIGWEAVGIVSWALIAYHWRERDTPAAAAHAFNTTRFGDLGLFVAAGAAFAGTGSLRYSDLGALDDPWLQALAAGVVLAAAAKSAQLPFSPWLFSAMGAPTPVSALLHAAAMVAAGAYLLVRLQPTLDQVSWFGPAVIGIGITTALVGGIVAFLQAHAKKLLAASTSAQYGLMFVAVGAGFPLVAVAHLVAHAIYKALLFLVAGNAATAVGTEDLGRMHLGRTLPWLRVFSAAGVLALAGVPPLGGAWTKEEIVAAAGHDGAWAAVLVTMAGGLTALYAGRFQRLAYGVDVQAPRAPRERPSVMQGVSVGVFAVATVGLGVLWLTGAQDVLIEWVGGTLPSGAPWELALSLGAVAVAFLSVWGLEARSRLVAPVHTPAAHVIADWVALPVLTRRAVVDPFHALCAALTRIDRRIIDRSIGRIAGVATGAAELLARADRRVVDAGVRGVAALATRVSELLARVAELRVEGLVRALAGSVATAGRDVRRVQTGFAHHYLAVVALALIALTLAAAIWR